jgi:prevent-host-death family protein
MMRIDLLVKTCDHFEMKSRISIGKAKPNLCDLVEQARQGQTHIITVHDLPAAQLGPIASRSEQLTNEWRQRRKKIFLNRKGQKQVDLAEMIREGRK